MIIICKHRDAVDTLHIIFSPFSILIETVT